MYFEEMMLGQELILSPARIEKEEMLAFARRYDNASLHTDEAYARASRFGALIAPGLMSFLCVWAKYLETDLFGEELIAGKSTKIEWFAPVFAGDCLYGRVSVSALSPRNAYNGLVTLSLEAKNQNGVLILAAEIKAVIKRRPESGDSENFRNIEKTSEKGAERL